MVQKLLKFVNGDIAEDDSDSIAFQECATPGHVYANILKFQISTHLNIIRNTVLKVIRARGVSLPDCTFLSLNNSYFSGLFNDFQESQNSFCC